MNRVTICLALLCASMTLAPSVQAGGCDCERCDVCGCSAQCEKTCKLIVGTKLVPKVTYCRQCEDICLPGPSRKCGSHCECTVNPCTGCEEHNKVIDWIPNPCGCIRTKAKLVKIETPQQVPTYKWVVVRVCGNCAKCGHMAKATATVDESQLAADKVQAPATEASSVVQASATEAVDTAPAPEKKQELASPALVVKSKLMSLLGK
jgi:hypothetical protein